LTLTDLSSWPVAVLRYSERYGDDEMRALERPLNDPQRHRSVRERARGGACRDGVSDRGLVEAIQVAGFFHAKGREMNTFVMLVLTALGLAFAQQETPPQVEGFPLFTPPVPMFTVLAEIENGYRVRHELGETLVPKNPQRIVALDIVAAEVLISLGAQPVGLTSPWLPEVVAEAAPEMTFLRTAHDLNLEAILALESDLIIVLYDGAGTPDERAELEATHEEFAEHPLWERVRTVQEDNVHLVAANRPSGYFSNPDVLEGFDTALHSEGG
jgi:ABC-type Fe3+-hydroxamate transport system substrate-binding protein